MADYPEQGSEIDNDYHPVDSGLDATNDHWGTITGDHAQAAFAGLNARAASPDLSGKLIDTGIWKRHQGAYPPARHPDHYGTPYK
jgi:hypothetical protein